MLAAGVAATWPRASFLTRRLPLNSDQSQDVWSLWWVARQITHLHNPWFTNYLAAPVGVQLGYDTLSPLLGLLMTPVTLLFGPSASYNLLVIATPGYPATRCTGRPGSGFPAWWAPSPRAPSSACPRC